MAHSNRSLHKVKDLIIFQDQHYNSFPNVIHHDGELLVAFRQAPDRRALFHKNLHIDPASKAVYVTSSDNGENWDEKPFVLYDDFYLGVQDPCITLLRDGTLFCSFFTWEVVAKDYVHENNKYREIEGKWMARLGGIFTTRSYDGGKSWDAPLPLHTKVAAAVRGNVVELNDGSILLPYYIHGKAFVVHSPNKGKTWGSVSTMASEEGITFHEPNLYQTKSGKLVAFIRSSIQDDQLPNDQRHPLVTCESHDQGRTWVNHQKHSIFSPSPFHALRLQSGNVLLTYGHRHKPYGIRALLLDPDCSNIDEAEQIILRDDGLGFDIGYTSSVQLDNGDILVTYYDYDEQHELRYIAGTLCRERSI